MIKKIKRKLISLIKYLDYFLFKKKYLFVGSPTHGNLGDHAIAICSLNFLNNHSKHKFKEISFRDYYKYKKFIIKWKPKTIVIIGGGNMGDLWPKEEDFHLDVIKTFTKAKIIILPQSIWFENDSPNNEYLLQMKDVYNSHKNLHLFAREKFSFNKMKELFPKNNIYLAPDMVLTSKQADNKCLNKKLLVLKRQDKEENNASTCNIKEAVSFFVNEGFNVEYSDTVVKNNVDSTSRKDCLNQLYKKIQNSSLVITDRLHGMVFSFINSTPVIVFNNNNLKITGTYCWLKKDPSILFSPNLKEIITFYKYVYTLKKREAINFDYSELRRIINE